MEPTVTATTYTVSCLPMDHPDFGAFLLRVERRAMGEWAVLRLGWCLSKSEEWDLEPQPSSRTAAWKLTHRFPLEKALALARKHAPLVIVNGFRVVDVLKRSA